MPQWPSHRGVYLRRNQKTTRWLRLLPALLLLILELASPVSDLGFRVQGLGFRVWDLSFLLLALATAISCLRFQKEPVALGFYDWGCRFTGKPH